jgi:hypothetical protein
MAQPYHFNAIQPLVAYPMPVTLPSGHGCLVVALNHGPYLVSAATTTRLKIDGHEVPIGDGTWHIPVPAGPHEVKITDFIGIPAIKTRLDVQVGYQHTLQFRFGGWRNTVHDQHGVDVSTFSGWSNYLTMLVTFGVIGVLCCGGCLVVVAASSTI